MLVSASLNRFYYFLLLAIACILFIGCRKEKPGIDIEGVTGYSWNVYTLQEANAYYIRPISANWRMWLNRDQSFSLDLDGSTCSGTYSWTPVDAHNARVMFTVKKWSGTSRPELLRTILQGVNSCYIYRPPNLPVVITAFTSPTMVLEFRGSEGYFGVYR